MPIKTSSGKWKWGNVERSSKKELVQTVYGIWKKNGSKGSFSDFLKGTHESIVNEYAGNKYFVKVDPRVQKYGQDSGYETLRSDDGKILGFKNSRGDCVIRALALATGLSYLNVAKKLHIKLDDKGDVPKDYGGTKWATVFNFFHQTAPSSAIFGMKQNLTVKEFARTISRHSKFKNTYFIVGCVDPSREYAHAVFVKNGRYYDSWDSGDWIVVDVFDATKERGINAQDYRNIVQIRRGTKKRYKKAADTKINESIEESYFVTDLDYNKHIKPILGIFKSWPHVNVENITKHDKDVKLKWFGLYTGHKLEDIVALVAIQTNFDDYTINIANVCSNGHGNGKKLLDKIIDYYSKTDRKYLVWFADPNGGEKLKNYYRTNFPDAKETEEKNEWWQTSKFTLKLKESVEPKDAKTYAYHCTDVDPEIIKKEGWKVGDGFTLDNQFKDLYKKYLPNVPVFVSRLDVPVWDYRSKYCIKLDITGIKLFPDFGHLPDFGAYYDYDEECFYWENEEDLDSNKKLKDFVLDNCDNLTLYADCFDGYDSFNVLGTACVDGSKLKDRIVEWKSSIKESYEHPYTLDTIKQKYGDEVYRKLRDDPVHRFRAETGIEVIHKEPTRDEFERIVKNWDLMTPEQKKRSDEFSMKQFGKNNKDRIDNIRKEYLKEYWAKNGRYFYCHDCDKNMSKAPDDQYIMIDDDLWEYVCKHGGKKIGTEEDLCRDCIEKRLGRSLTLKDLGDKINLPINVEIKKLLKKRKNKMTNEAHEIHSYPEKLQPTLERIVKDNEDYELDHAYFNKEGKFIWMRNSKGYFHIFKPVKFVKTPGMTKPFGFKDLILKDNGMLEEVDRLRFADGNEGLKFLKDKYHLELKTIS